MPRTLSEITAQLGSGAKLQWDAWGDFKAGSVTLTSPGARRLFEYLMKQDRRLAAEANERLFEGIIASWDADNDPADTTIETADSFDPKASWRLYKVEAQSFGGLSAYGVAPFELEVDGENWALEGHNGSGKTSLFGAIVWAMTGKRVREQDGLIEEAGKREPVHDSRGTRLGDWPPIAAYPSDRGRLAGTAEVWVRLTFKSQDGRTVAAFRRLVAPSLDAPTIEVSVAPELREIPQLLETGILMPARIPRVGFGTTSQSLYEAVKMLTGLDHLSVVAEAAANFGNHAKRFLKYAKDNGAETQALTFQTNASVAMKAAGSVGLANFSVPKLDDDALDAKALREDGKTYGEQAAAHLLTIKDKVAASVDISSQTGRKSVAQAIQRARTLVDQAKTIDLFSQWSALTAAGASDQFAKLPVALDEAEQKITEALKWHDKQQSDRLLRLKALGAKFYHVPETEHEVAHCPLCAGLLTTTEQQLLADELKLLKSDAEVAERRLDDVCAQIERSLRALLPADISKVLEAVVAMQPRDAYRTAMLVRFAEDSPFSDVLQGVAKFVRSALDGQHSTLPEFIRHTAKISSIGDAPPAVRELRTFTGQLGRLVDFVEWWGLHRKAFRDAWLAFAGNTNIAEVPAGQTRARSLSTELTELEEAYDKAQPFDDLSEALTKCADAGQRWQTIRAEQDKREDIANALSPLKSLKDLVAVETASSISLLSGRVKTILERIHWHERLAFADAALGKRSVEVTGVLSAGMHMDASLIANTSWLRAVLWAFVLALREQTIETLGRNPFPLVVLDDPQTTLDPRNKRKWADELSGLANRDQSDPLGCQMILLTHERQFFQFITESNKLRGHLGLIAGLNAQVEHVTIINGTALTRAFTVAASTHSDADGASYVLAVRIYIEDLLKIMLRSEGEGVASLNLGTLSRLLRELVQSGVPPYNREAFLKLDKTLSGGGSGRVISILNDSHHTADGTIGYAQAVEVHDFWQKTLETQMSNCFETYSAFVAHTGDPRVFPWAPVSAALPPSRKGEIKGIRLLNTGIAAAAKTDGRAGDGALSFEELPAPEAIALFNHDIFQLTAGTLDPVATIGDCVIVSNYAEVHERNLVVAAVGSQLVARRLNRSELHPDIAVLTGQSVDPQALVQPIIAQLNQIEPKKIVGTIFTHNRLPTAHGENDAEFLALDDLARIKSIIDGTGLFRVDGRSAEPLALDGQYLMTKPKVLDASTLLLLDGQLAIAVDDSGTRYFKRLRNHHPIVVLESLNPDGTTAAELLTLDGTLGLPKLVAVMEVVGVLFELP